MPNIEKDGVIYDPVDVDAYPDRDPADGIRTEEETRLAEGRHLVGDQDPDYAERMGVGSPIPVPSDEVVAELRRQAAAEALGVAPEEVPEVVVPVNDPVPEPAEE
jgi:hypothetical protein